MVDIFERLPAFEISMILDDLKTFIRVFAGYAPTLSFLHVSHAYVCIRMETQT